MEKNPNPNIKKCVSDKHIAQNIKIMLSFFEKGERYMLAKKKLIISKNRVKKCKEKREYYSRYRNIVFFYLFLKECECYDDFLKH